MPIIIDGWNFIRNRKSDIRDDGIDALESAELLMSCLDEFQKTHKDPIKVVFDSTYEYLGIGYKNSPRLYVIAASNADEYIRKYIENTPERQRRNLRVVSSDKSVFYHAKTYYATPVKCEEFWDKINKAREERCVA